MSYYDSKRNEVIKFEPKPVEGYPGWVWIDCGCSAGLVWNSGSECGDCNGRGMIVKHMKTGTLASYPGGPLCGKEKPEELEAA